MFCNNLPIFEVLFGLQVLSVVLFCEKVSNSETYWRSSLISQQHPCNRPCHAFTKPLECTYNFVVTVEHTNYTCDKCQLNTTSYLSENISLSDCHGQECVLGDAYQRVVYLVNNRFPGPDITVCEGDKIVVYVNNSILNEEAITIHWHGMHQIGTPHMDGTPMVTQCPILKGGIFRYEFSANPGGTAFWHSHTAFLRADGLVGPLIVRKRIQQIPKWFEEKFYLKSKSFDKLPLIPTITPIQNEIYDKRRFSTSLPPQNNNTHSKIKYRSFYRKRQKDQVCLREYAQHLFAQDQDNVIIVQEWKHDISLVDYMLIDAKAKCLVINGRKGTPKSPPAITVINRKNYFGGANKLDKCDDEATKKDIPWLRIISNGFLSCPIQAHLEGHRLKLIALDGVELEDSPIFDILTIFPGERLDVQLIQTDFRPREQRPPSVEWESFALHWISHGDCLINSIHANATSYIVYRNQDITNSLSEQVLDDDYEDCNGEIITATSPQNNFDHLLQRVMEMNLNPSNTPNKAFDWQVALNTSIGEFELFEGEIELFKGEFELQMIFNPTHMEDFNQNDRYIRLNDIQPLEKSKIIYNNIKSLSNLAQDMLVVDHKIFLFVDSPIIYENMPIFNNISYRAPSHPLLTQFSQIDKRQFCNYETHPHCKYEFCACTHLYNIPLGSVIEIILVDEGLNGEYDIHSVHLHGSYFIVLAQEKMGPNVTIERIKLLDENGKLRRNYTHYSVKDSVSIPEGGYTIVRFRADNPGFWMFHCHLHFHLFQGMAVVFQIGNITQMRPTPSNFPQCGPWLSSYPAHL